MTSPVRLTSVGIAHAAVLAALHGRCFDDAWSERAMAEVLGSPGTFAVVAQPVADGTVADGTVADGTGGEPVGFALARQAGDDAELLMLCVLAGDRRRGIGAALLDDVLRRARQIGARQLFLEVAETNDAARALYATRGFVAGRRRPDYYRGPNRVPTAALELRRNLEA